MEPTHRTALLIVGGLFLLYLLLKLRVSFIPGGPELRAARRRVADAKKQARDRTTSTEQRAAAWRDASMAALAELQRPDLAASYALRAERLDPGDRAAVGLLSTSMRRGARLKALEKLLWRRLDSRPVGSPAHDEAFQQLLSLYEGPLRAPERARALRALRRATTAPSD